MTLLSYREIPRNDTSCSLDEGTAKMLGKRDEDTKKVQYICPRLSSKEDYWDTMK